MSFRLDVDLRASEIAERLYREAAAGALEDGVEHLLTESNVTVPLEEATLERSGKASVDRPNLKGAVSYDTPYAARQHEETTWRHAAGRRAKWLELTFREQSIRIINFLGDAMRRRLP